MRINEALLDATCDIAEKVLQFDGPADRVLSMFFRENPRLGKDDRAFVADTIYALLRRRRWVEWHVKSDVPRALVLGALVLVCGKNMRELEPWISTRELTALRDTKGRRSDAELEPPSIGVELDLPDWLIELLLPAMGEAALRELARVLAQGAPLDLRVNAFRADRDAVLKEFEAAGIPAQPTAYAPQGIRIVGNPALNKMPVFLEGRVEVQDEGSQLVCHLVAPRRGEMIVDFCAGAGGKTLALGALMRSTGRVYAFDVSDKRLAHLKPRLARSGLSNVHPKRIDSERDHHLGRLAGKIDRVLVDAPCTGLGTLRRNPDLKWRQTPASVAELAIKQLSILRSASKLLKSGGRLVYATCSLLDQENEHVIEHFLAEESGFQLIDATQELARQGIDMAPSQSNYLRLWPHVHSTDGFFAAILERAASASPPVPDPSIVE
ncbi:MAG: RsmB/NOP family class I SAM-dependent RNA methyltransferase [Betaproteobacteria bacterium]|nr:RsmB/NOP family class I SAM-dependent RNA methyltransferase [Betaproteobacteria bacterium]